jgi:hypothetical protein
MKQLMKQIKSTETTNNVIANDQLELLCDLEDAPVRKEIVN